MADTAATQRRRATGTERFIGNESTPCKQRSAIALIQELTAES
jgi:hypothetical protein